MLQAGRQFVLELRSAAKPEALPDPRGRDRKAGEQQRAKPCEESGGYQKSADELGKDGGTRESRRPRQSVAPDLFDARTPMPELVDAAVKEHGRQTQPGDQESILGQFGSLLRAAIRCLTVGSPSA